MLCRNKGITDMIAQAVEQIRNTVSLSVLDESATKQGVVLRLLSLAGWDTFDVSQVVPEYTVGTRRVDYALRPGSPNAVFIEVKRPGENLERHQQQLLEYCFQEGVKLAVLTNGRTWWLYLPLQAGSWEQRRFLTIDLEVQEPSVVEHRFLEYLSPERMGTGQAVGDAEDLVESQQRAEIIGKTIAAAWAQIVETPDELLVDLISETTERICGFKPERSWLSNFWQGAASCRAATWMADSSFECRAALDSRLFSTWTMRRRSARTRGRSGGISMTRLLLPPLHPPPNPTTPPSDPSPLSSSPDEPATSHPTPSPRQNRLPILTTHIQRLPHRILSHRPDQQVQSRTTPTHLSISSNHPFSPLRQTF